MSAARRRAPLIAFGLVLAGAAALLLSLDSGLTFYQDTWAFLMHRQGSSAADFLEPHNEHIVVIPVAILKLQLALFGMGSATPEFFLLTVLLLVTAVLLFVYVRRRLGDWPALFAATLVLFLGPAWQVLLWPFEMTLLGSTMAGLAMLLALEREDRAGDLAACLLLAVSIGFSSLGVAFAVGAGVDVLQHRRNRGLARLYLAAIPLALYGAWYLAYGHEAESSFSIANVFHSPIFVLEGLAASLAALTGISVLTGSVEARPWAGMVLLAALLVALAYWLWRRRPAIYPRLWPVAATAATFWFLGGFNRGAGREAEASRYMHVGAILLLLMAADLLKGARLGTRAALVGAALVVAICAVNLDPLEDGHDYFREQTVLTRSDLGAMQIAERTISPYFALGPTIAGTGSLIDVNAPEYFEAEADHGTPAYTPAELARAPEAGRRQADVVLSQALPLATVTETETALPAGLGPRCDRVVGGVGEVKLRPGVTQIGLLPGPPARFSLRRFARGEFPVPTAGAPGDSVTTLKIPRDGAPQPWFLQVEAAQGARVCWAGPLGA